MSGAKVLILEDDLDLAATYVALFALLGDHTAWVVHSLSALQQHSRDALACGLAFLDIDLGRGMPSGIDAYHWLREQNFPGKIYFLTGHAQSHPLVAKAITLGAAQVLSKPVDIDVLLAIVEETRNS